MGILDIILLICFVPAIIMGLRSGFIKQVFGIAAVILGVWLATHYTPDVAKWMGMQFEAPEKFINVLSFALILIAGIAVFEIIGSILSKLFDKASLSFLDRTLGFAFAILKTALLLGILVYLFDGLNEKWALVKPETLDASVIYSWLKAMAVKIFPYLKELAGNINV